MLTTVGEVARHPNATEPNTILVTHEERQLLQQHVVAMTEISVPTMLDAALDVPFVKKLGE